MFIPGKSARDAVMTLNDFPVVSQYSSITDFIGI